MNMAATPHSAPPKLPPIEGNPRLTAAALTPLIKKSVVSALHGLPFPAQFRNQGALEGWRQLFSDEAALQAIWQQWAQPEFTCLRGIECLKHLLPKHPPADCVNQPPYVGETMDRYRTQISTMLLYDRRQGTIIETTSALETLLAHSDVDASIPMGMIAPPYRAQYLCFGEQARSALLPDINDSGLLIDGVFCFASMLPCGDGTNTPTRQIHLVFIFKRNGCACGFMRLEQPIVSPQMPLSDWVARIYTAGGKEFSEASRERITELVGYVAKVFLYLGLKETRQIKMDDYSAALKRMAGLGAKKQAKLGRRLASLVDRIVVGPESLPAMHSADAAGHEVAPHWRRGHFRMQTHGPNNRDRKLIFVAPLLVRADRLNDEPPQPKAYRAGR